MINSLRITQFKNYEALQVDFDPGLNFITGLNGTGKTNLLDALYYICVLKSFNTPQDRHNVMFGKEWFRLDAQTTVGTKAHRVVVKVKPGSSKEILIDDVPRQRLSDHLGFLPVIVLSPSDQILVEGASAERRKFADFYLCQTDREYLAALQMYNRLLLQRNSVLKTNGQYSDSTLLMAYAEKMTAPAALIRDKRRKFVKVLQPLVADMCRRVSAGADLMEVEFVSSLGTESFVKVCEDNLERDKTIGRTSAGVHRDDLLFTISGRLLRRFGSQGQRKTYLVAVHLAIREYLVGAGFLKPVILLDDIFDKLDEARINEMLELLTLDGFGQVFISDARPARIDGICSRLDIEAKVIHIRDGAIYTPDETTE